MGDALKISCLCFAVVVLVTFGWAAEPDSEPEQTSGFTDQVSVNLVNIDVFVRDGKGDAVTDLEIADFIVRQDGEVQEITNFAVLTEEVFVNAYDESVPVIPAPLPEPTRPVDSATEEAPELRPIWLVLYVDSENLHPIHATRVLRRVREFVNVSLRPPVQMMVVANQAGLKVVQPFTDDPRAVNGALRGIGEYSGGWVDRESARNDLIAEMHDEKANNKYGGGDYEQNSGQRGGSNTRRGVYQRIVSYAQEESNNLSFSLSALRQAIDTLAGLEGRKSIIYVSDGLPMTPGLGLMHEYASVYHDNSILSNHVRFNAQQKFRSLTSAAASQNVIFYTIDAQGLEVGLGGSADAAYEADPTASQLGSSNFQGTLRYMAARTGGIAVVNTNDVERGLRRVREDLFTYYSIGFPVPTFGRDSVHKIEVEIIGKKGLDLRYRRRFVEKSLETKIHDQVVAGLLLGVSDNPMSVAVAHERPAPASGEYWTVPVTVAVPLEAITLVPAGDSTSGHVLLIVGTRDARGRQSDIQRQEHEILVPAEEAERPSHWKVDVRFLMQEGQHRVVVGVLDQISHRVSYETMNLVVP